MIIKVPVRLVVRSSLLISILLAGCTWPSYYSDRKSGRILDHDGKPLPGTYAYTQVMRECVSLGGHASQVVKTAYTMTDERGRYARSISGVGILDDFLLGGCVRFTFNDFACRQWQGCSVIRNEGDFVLNPGYDLAFMLFNLPAEIKSTLSGCPLRRWATPRELTGWEKGVYFKTLFYCTEENTPATEVSADAAIAWIKFTSQYEKAQPVEVKSEWITNGSYLELPQPLLRARPSNVNIEMFAIAERDGVLRPIGGIRWGYGVSGVPTALDVAVPGDWGDMLQYARGQIPLDILKRLPNAPPPPQS